MVIVDNGDPIETTADLMIRDHDEDVGALPSNLGGEKFYKSPDIKISEFQPDYDDPIWSQPQTMSVDEGEELKVWVRVTNHGCEPITGFSVSLAEANFALIASDWEYVDQIEPQKEFPNTTIDPGEGVVVGFDWIPDVDGHRCLLAAVTNALDPTSVPLDQDDLIDFGQLDGPDSLFTPFDNNLAQRNVKIEDTDDMPNAFVNPFDVTVALGLEFDCNEFPIFESGAQATLVVEHNSAAAQAWSNAPGTTLVDTGSVLELSFNTCKVRLPDVVLPPATALGADMDLELPAGTFGTYEVDLTAYVDGNLRGGASFYIEKLPDPQ